MPIVNANGGDLYYEVRGDGAPILGIHGTPSSVLLWVDAAGELAGCGRCIIYERRGFPRSKAPEPFDSVDLTDHVDDAAALLDALSATPAVVIGRSTGGLIAVALAHRYPDKVHALVLLEPAMFSADPEGTVWTQQLGQQVLQAAADNPAVAAQAVIRDALGELAWQSLPIEVQELFTAASPAVLAEIRGRGLDLSEEPFDLSVAELAEIGQPTLLVSSEDSPEVLRRVNDRLAATLPNTETVLVPGGHFIHPAHPAVLNFVSRILAPPGQDDH